MATLWQLCHFCMGVYAMCIPAYTSAHTCVYHVYTMCTCIPMYACVYLRMPVYASVATVYLVCKAVYMYAMCMPCVYLRIPACIYLGIYLYMPCVYLRMPCVSLWYMPVYACIPFMINLYIL